jgi:uncharacterized protein
VTAALYTCQITHVRTQPARRSFRYGSYLWLVDLDDLPPVPGLLRPLAGFRARDHLGGPGGTIRGNVDAYLARHGVDLAGGRVLMLASASTLGRAFNPLSLFWCYAADGRLAAVLAEVQNTYRGRHVYLLRPDASGRTGTAKEFYVSPFLPLAGQYRMRLPEPGQRLHLSITLDVDERPALVASVRGVRHEYSRAALLRCLVRYPGGAARVSLLIRWQGLRLFARRLPIYRRPAGAALEGIQ